MIGDDYFSVLPVYRLKSEDYYKRLQDYIDKQFENDPQHIKDAYRESPELKIQWESHFRDSYGGVWEFNEIIGYIKLFFFRNQVRGEYWSVNKKRIVKSRKKQFGFTSRKLAGELTIRDRSNEGVLSTIRKYIGGCEKELRNRHLDTREFESLAPYVNWAALYEDHRRV